MISSVEIAVNRPLIVAQLAAQRFFPRCACARPYHHDARADVPITSVTVLRPGSLEEEKECASPSMTISYFPRAPPPESLRRRAPH
jgi:hypothetical protein